MELLDATNMITIPEDGPVRIMPLSDLQFGAQDTNVDLIKEWVRYGQKNRCYYIGLGDYIDFMSPSNRARLEAAALYDNSREALDDLAIEHTDELYDILRPTRGRWLGMLHGHHFFTFLNGHTSDEHLADKLESPYLGTTAMVGITFPKMGTVVIWATHGSGGGSTAAGHLGKLERIASTFDAHIYLMAHVTKLAHAKIPRLIVNWKTLEMATIDRHIASTGGFMEGYKPGRRFGDRPAGSYVEQKMMAPTALGASMITIYPRMTRGIFTPDIRIEV